MHRAAILIALATCAGCQLGWSLRTGHAVTRTTSPATLRHPDGVNEDVELSASQPTIDTRIGGSYVLGGFLELGVGYAERLRARSELAGYEARTNHGTIGVGLALQAPPGAPVGGMLYVATGTGLGVTATGTTLVDGYRKLGVEVSLGGRFRAVLDAGVLWQDLDVAIDFGREDEFMLNNLSTGSFETRGIYVSFGFGGAEWMRKKKRQW